MNISEKARVAKNVYQNKWRTKNKEHVRKYNNEYMKQYRQTPEGKEKIQQASERYWEKKYELMNGGEGNV